MAHFPVPLIWIKPVLERVNTDYHWVKGPDGPRLHKAKLRGEQIPKHLNGGPAVGACPIRKGSSTTRIALIDLDSHRGETDWDTMTATASRLATALESRGLRPQLLRSSGGHGIHLVMLWESEQDAFSVREELFAVLAEVGLDDGAGGVARNEAEVFPKQDQVEPDGWGSMFILPFAGESVCLDPLMLEADESLAPDWPLSAPVAVRERPVGGEVVVNTGPVDLERFRSALMAVPNTDDTDYFTWRDVIFSIHAATGGSAIGQAMAIEWSEKSVKGREPGAQQFLTRRVWPHIRTDRRGKTITAQRVINLAMAAGWEDPADPITPIVEVDQPDPLPSLERDKQGRIKAKISSLEVLLRREAWCPFQFALDTFRDGVVKAPIGTEEWQEWTDEDEIEMRVYMERKGCLPISRDLMRDAVRLVARDRQFDSGQLWMATLQWDGIERIEQSLATYLGATDDEYTRAAARYLWTALAGRVITPGVKADMALIFVGGQGVGKSRAAAALSPFPDGFVEISFSEDEKEIARKLRGAVVAEIGELRGLHTRELEHIKAFMSRQVERFVPKFKEFAVSYPRRCVFVGTTNQDQFLADETGNRRWLPIKVGVNGSIDVDGLAADREQLWAEAAVLYRRSGVAWTAEELAAPAHEEARLQDAWEETVRIWLDRDATYTVTTDEVAREALGLSSRDINRGVQMRISGVLKVLGWEFTRAREGGRQFRAWVKRGAKK